ncbi:unnamed protein product [Clonostachys rosea f. rosea IK726]|uniref:Uncharacterized protein n=1 Tax=Clonostachys rosea f. rosea IK726 TaxID=1349383 RepID=A0ACA9UL05_BIOOC|nr:unnamed protein product [Clonostachys rosea f. rosea IK726]
MSCPVQSYKSFYGLMHEAPLQKHRQILLDDLLHSRYDMGHQNRAIEALQLLWGANPDPRCYGPYGLYITIKNHNPAFSILWAREDRTIFRYHHPDNFYPARFDKPNRADDPTKGPSWRPFEGGNATRYTQAATLPSDEASNLTLL